MGRKRSHIDFDHFNAFMGTGVDPINRVIHLSDALDGDDDEEGRTQNDSSSRVIRGLMFLDRLSADPILFYIDTPGGSEFKMLAIYDTMTTCRSPITTIALGAVQSAGGLLLAAGDTRYAAENSYFMAHHGDSRLSGDYSSGELRSYTGLLGQMERQWASLMERHTNRGAEWWTDELNRRSEVWLTPKEMLDLGIVDGIYVVGGEQERDVNKSRAKTGSTGPARPT